MTAEQKTNDKPVKRRKGAKSIYRTIGLLRTIAAYNELGINLSDLSRKTTLPVATVHRIVSVLVSEELVSFDPLSKCYRLGFGLYMLGGNAQQFSIRDTYRKCIEQIAQSTGETVHLLVRAGFDSLCIDLVEGKFPIRSMAYDVGDRRPLGVGAGSLALVTFLPFNETETILQANRNRYPDYGGLNVEQVRRMVDTSLSRGHVFNEGKFQAGVTGVGVPVYGPDDTVIAAVSVASISERMGRERAVEIADTMRHSLVL